MAFTRFMLAAATCAPVNCADCANIKESSMKEKEGVEKAYARVRITVEVEVDRYGNDFTIKEVCEGARAEAIERVRAFRAPLYPDKPLRIIGEPEVLVIMHPA